MEIDLPEVMAEVTAAFNRYEKALVTNDLEVLDDTFHVDPRTIRYDGSEILCGFEEIAAFPAPRAPTPGPSSPPTAATLPWPRRCFTARPCRARFGQQMQTWVRLADG